MVGAMSFTIVLLGLEDPSIAGRKKFVNVMKRLTSRDPADLERALQSPSEPLFRALDRDRAISVVQSLEDSGVWVEVKPTTDAAEDPNQLAPTVTCPRCGSVQPVMNEECERCGLVFAKYEREKIQKMQRERQLEEALTKALQAREEWVQRAKNYLDGHRLPEGAILPFEKSLFQDEVTFLRLNSDEGPILLTSRRMVYLRNEQIGSLPYEFITDVDFGGGLVHKRTKVRLQLTFPCPLVTPDGEVKMLVWNLDKESAFFKDIIMDWAFARHFMCGACGQRDLDFRLDGTTPHARCMHCATDHELDLKEAVAIPLIQE